MSRCGPTFRLVCLLSSTLCEAVCFAEGAEPQTKDFDFFEKKIRPVLVERCYKCHSAASEKLKAGLRLDSREGMLRGGESGKPAIVPGKPRQSRLIEAIGYENEDLQMPPKNKLTDEQIADFV